MTKVKNNIYKVNKAKLNKLKIYKNKVDKVIVKKSKVDKAKVKNVKVKKPKNVKVDEEIINKEEINVLTYDNIQKWTDSFNNDASNLLVQNIMSANNISHIAIDRYKTQYDNTVYNRRIEPIMKITNQKGAGLCWLYAGLNIIRPVIAKRFNLKEDFEFSISFLYFYDTLEKINLFFDDVTANKNNPKKLKLLMNREEYIPDGGDFYNFQYLVEKYGLIPKNIFNDSIHCECSDELKSILNKMCLSTAVNILKGNTYDKDEVMKDYYHLLMKFIGTPPTNFDWEYYDNDEHSKYHNIQGLCPLTFYHCIIKKLVNLNDFITICNDTREKYPYNKTYIQEPYSMNPYGIQISFNMDIQRIKELIVLMINKNLSVWFGCDLNQHFTPYVSILDTTAFNYSKLLNIESYKTDKCDRIKWNTLLYLHAMVLIGHKNINDKYQFECANSWGDEDMIGDGYLHISEKWIDENLYSVVIHKSLLTNNEIKQYNTTPTIVPIDD